MGLRISPCRSHLQSGAHEKSRNNADNNRILYINYILEACGQPYVAVAAKVLVPGLKYMGIKEHSPNTDYGNAIR
jgi:hypothetical protein